MHVQITHQPIVVTSVQLLGMTLQFHSPEQRDTATDVFLFLVQHSGTHSQLSVRDPSLTLTQFCARLAPGSIPSS